MADILIRGLPEEILAELDARAAKLGVSRTEYIRRRLTQDTAYPTVAVAVADLQQISTTPMSCRGRGSDQLAHRQVRTRPTRREC